MSNQVQYPVKLFDMLKEIVSSAKFQIDELNNKVKIKNRSRPSNWQIKKQINRELRKYEKSKIKN